MNRIHLVRIDMGTRSYTPVSLMLRYIFGCLLAGAALVWAGLVNAGAIR